MLDSTDPTAQHLIKAVEGVDDLTEMSTAVKNLKAYAEAKKLLEPDPIPDPEPSGIRGFFHRHAGDLIKVGGTITVVSIIAAIEAKGDVIFRSKASKYI